MKSTNLKSKIKNQKCPPGFTLVELLVVMGIILLLAAILVPSVSYALKMARKGATEALIQNVCQAVEMYRSQLGAMPESRIDRNPTDVGYWTTNQRYRDLMGAEILAQALVGFDNEVIRRPANNPIDANNLYDLPADLCPGLGLRNSAVMALEPNPGNLSQKRTIAALDDTGAALSPAQVQLTGQKMGPYFPEEKLAATNMVLNAVTTGALTDPPAVGNPLRKVIMDPFGNPLLYYKAQRPRYHNSQVRQTLVELSNAQAGMDRRDTGVNRTVATLPLYVEPAAGAAGVDSTLAPIYDLDHNADILAGQNPTTDKSYKPVWAATSTDALRRWLKGWNGTGAKTNNSDEDTVDAGFEQVNQGALRAQDFLILSAGVDGVFGRAQAGDAGVPETCKADDVGNFSFRK